jgi:hypothetical protein
MLIIVLQPKNGDATPTYGATSRVGMLTDIPAVLNCLLWMILCSSRQIRIPTQRSTQKQTNFGYENI